jgi:hypothetical protein
VQRVTEPADAKPSIPVGLESDLVLAFLVGMKLLIDEEVAEEIAVGVVEREARFLGT